MKTKRTGDWYKVRVWDARNVTWNQLRQLPADETEAIEMAKRAADEGARTQAIHLVKKGKNVSVDVVYDSEGEK